ncbi:putative membrane protein [Kushneria avicenniae]|uniref:Putative membrane protein n=1 Tax=Kushneria avicenniae TaxID=402385 RepID=A0A1I1GEK8_9GAMM|nr:TIGR01620 family protein [Kushneria avicenniae]SFC10179.1 putative membrane protein [Kushneria avicenniae]
MNDPRPGRRFDVSGDDKTARTSEAPPLEQRFVPVDPAPGARYQLDSVHHPLEDEAPPEQIDSALDHALARPRKRRWGLLSVLAGTLLMGGVQAVDTFQNAWFGGDWVSGAWSVLGLGVVTLAGTSLTRELVRLKRLRRHARLREDIDAHILDPGIDGEHMQKQCDRLRTQMGLGHRDPHWQDFLRARQDHHDARETRDLFSHYVLAPRDASARRLITRMSSETALLVAVSPVTLIDMGLMAWRNLRMIDRLAALYGLELGYASRLRLFRAVLANMAFAGASEIATDVSMDLLSMNLAGRLSSRAGQGMASGLLTARLGIRTLRMLRPLPFEDDRAPKLSDLRRQLWQQMKRVDDGKASNKKADDA